MIQITPQMRVLVGVEPADFRAGIDGLAERCRQVPEVDPFSGTLFVFRNRRRTAIKVLVYDGQGFCSAISASRTDGSASGRRGGNSGRTSWRCCCAGEIRAGRGWPRCGGGWAAG